MYLSQLLIFDESAFARQKTGRFLCIEQAAARTLAVIIESMPGDEDALPAMLRQGAGFGIGSGALIKALTNTGLGVAAEQWVSIVMSTPSTEVQPSLALHFS